MMPSKDSDCDGQASGADWVYEPSSSQSRRSGAAVADRKRHILERIVEAKVIPRLLIADLPGVAAMSSTLALPKPAFADKVGDFAELVVGRDGDAAIAYFKTLREQGASLEALYQDLLAPAAMRLGELWNEDINDFMDVTRGFSHLQQIVHLFSGEFMAEGRQQTSSRRTLLVPLPGEQHVFGATLVGQYFRREGWRVWGGPPNSFDELLELVAGQWFDAIGLSASVVKDPATLASDIKALRRASCNRYVTILIGGRVFNQFPQLVAEVGADATAADGKQAVSHLQQRLARAQKSR
jgi:MerR family transcriptional regulator, light-induced transcriptional regulator